MGGCLKNAREYPHNEKLLGCGGGGGSIEKNGGIPRAQLKDAKVTSAFNVGDWVALAEWLLKRLI